MDDTISLVAWAYKGVLGGATVLIGYFTKNLLDDMKDSKIQLRQAQNDIAAHKLHVSETYAKDATIQQSLARVHDRMDEGFKELRNELRTINKK